MNDYLKRLDSHFMSLRDKVALRDDIRQPGITYGQLDELSGRIYGYLKERGIGREDTVMLCLPRGMQIPVAMVGVWKAGASYVICEDTYAPERIEFIRKDCDCKLFVSRDNWAELMGHDYLPGRETVHPHDLAYTVYTSGTTGNPKGVMHEFGNIEESCAFQVYEGERFVTESDILAMNAPMNFVAFQGFFNSVLYAGGTMLIVAYSYVKNLPSLIKLYEEAGVTCTFLTPSGFRMLGTLNPQLRWIVLGGEPCANLYRDEVILYNGLGMSEAGFAITLFRLDRAYDVTPAGRNHGGRALHILDEAGRGVPDGEPGELCFENPFVRGYRNLPEKTAEAWRDGLFHSGDIVVRGVDGNLTLQGRGDDMIKINGNRIEPAEIEAACKKVLPLSWVCAKGFVGDKQSFVALYYTDDIEVDPALMREELAKLLPYYMIPSYYVKIDAVPLLPNGKLNKMALAAPDTDAYLTDYAAPENETEKRLCDAFAKILGRDRVGVNDDFYELGGDSLRSMEAVAELEELGLEVSHIFKHRTARRIAATLLVESADEGQSLAHRNENALEHDQPLNPFQVYMFDYQLYAPHTTMYNMPVCWKYATEDMDSACLSDAVKKVLEAHPVFRTVLRYNEDFELVQHYDETIPTEVPVERMTEKEVESILPQLVEPFRLLDRPMYRVRLFETPEHVYLFLDLHHIISDGTSMAVLSEDLTAAFEGRPLAEDMYYLFMRDQYKASLSADYVQAEEYFRHTYGGKNWINVHKPEIESRENAFAWVTRKLELDKDALEQYLASAGIGRTAFFEAAALLTLAAMEDAENVMVTWVYHGRDNRRKERSIGLFVKDLPLGVTLGELTDTRSLYETVKEQMNMGIVHREYPYSTINAAVAVNDTLAVIDEGDLLSMEGLGAVPFERVKLPQANPAMGKQMLATIFNRRGIELRLNYTATRYHRESMERFCDIYKRIVTALAASGPDTPVRGIMQGALSG